MIPGLCTLLLLLLLLAASAAVLYAAGMGLMEDKVNGLG
jgi:hypothetical protein